MMKTWKMRDGDTGRSGGAFQFERLAVRITRWRAILLATGVGVFSLGLVATLPAEIVAPKGRDAVGTVWNGQMALNDGFVVGWKLKPFTSIFSLSLVGDITVRGPETDLAGEGLMRPGRLLLRDVTGTASTRLINAAARSLPFTCEAVAQVDISELAIRGAAVGAGTIRTSPGQCVPQGGQGDASPLPALVGTLSADAGATQIALDREGSGEAVARARISPDGALSLSIEQGGVGVLPGVGAPVSLETTL